MICMTRVSKIIVLFWAFTASVSFAHVSDPQTPPKVITGMDVAVAETAYGKVRGYISGGIYNYRGIPYAQAKRFMPPEKPEPWKEIKSSLAWGAVCPQMFDRSNRSDEIDFLFQFAWGYENENCQGLNIWTPDIKQGKRPVMVWLHGGGFIAGSSQTMPSFNGANLSKKGNVVVVSLNHRLNVFGFADLSDFGDKYQAAANTGMMDIVAALKWVRENIANFGGDPDNVTIFGQSGGGAKVGTIMYAPSARGLFHKAVIQSGADPHFQDPVFTKRLGRKLVEELGLNQDNIDTIQSVPATDLLKAAERALDTMRKEFTSQGKPTTGLGFGFSPSLDGTFLPFDSRDPKALAFADNVPLLIGSTKHEFVSTIFMNPQLAGLKPDEVMNFIQQKYGKKAALFIEAINKAYPEDQDPHRFIDIDTLFRQACVTQADLQSSAGNAPVFMYLFSWKSPVLDGRFKAFHSLDLPFMFNNIELAGNMTSGSAGAHALADRISRAWIQFARKGDPNHSGLPEWPAYTKQNGATMIFDDTCTIRRHHDKDLLDITAGGTRLW
jgi:para-nitrobenzyl esterase